MGRLHVSFSLLGGVLVLFLALPFAYFLGTLGSSQLPELTQGQTLHALAVSVITATIATALLALFGVPLGYVLARRDFPGKSALTVLLFLPLIAPPAASGIMLLLFFGPNQGLGALLNAAGIRVVDNLAGIILAQMFVSTPFVAITTRAAFEAVPGVHESIARTLGETAFGAFWRVALPLARDGIAAGIIFAWMRSMGEFGATLILAYHPYTLPVLMWVQLTGSGMAYALPVVLLAVLVTVIVLTLLFRYDRRLRLLAAEPAQPARA